MNKKILYSILILLSFCFISNVNAQSYEFETDLFGTVTVDIDELISGKDLTGNFILTKNSNETTLEIIFESKDYELTFTGRFTNLSGTRYVNTYSSKYDSSTGSWKTPTATTYGITTNYNNIYYTNIDTIPVYNTSINMKYDENDGIYFEETDTSRGDLICVGTSGGGYLAYKNENTKLIEFYYNNSKTNSFSYESYPYYFLSSNNANYCQFYYSAEEFYYNTTTEYITANTTSYWIRPQTNSTEDDSSKITQDPVVYSSFDIYDENGNLYYSSSPQKSPTIEIIKTDEKSVTIAEEKYITDITLNIEFSYIDINKYAYQYKYGSESEWVTVSNSFSKTYKTNDTLYVQIIDIETHKLVTSKTYTITSINKLPDVYLDEDTINSSYDSRDVIFHKCDLSLESGIALCEITLNNVDTELYNYYHKVGDSTYKIFYPNEKTEVLPEVYDTSLLLKNNDDISLYKKWNSGTNDSNTYLLTLKIYENTTIIIMRETKETGFKQYYSYTITSLTEASDMGKIEQFIYNHLLSKFYFVNQFKQIIEYVNSYNFEEDSKAPSFTFDLSFIGLQPVTVDMEIDEHSRLLIQGYIKLFASIAVVYTFIKETAKLFKN